MLPPGIHTASLTEVQLRFATNPHRQRLFDGFRKGVFALRKARCIEIFLDGSFITDKSHPGDFDACWNPTGVDESILDPVLIDARPPRANQKAKYFGEFLPSSASGDRTSSIVEYFQQDRHTGKPKGIIRIELPGKPEAQ